MKKILYFISILLLISLLACDTSDSFINPKDYKVTLIYNLAYLSSKNTLGIKNIIIHPNYDYATDKDDIALVQLEQPVDKDIPLQKISFTETDFNNFTAIYVGRGPTTEDGEDYSSKPRQATQTIQDLTICQNIFADPITQAQICATALNSSPCPGDSGGPLYLFNQEEQPIQIGIVSFSDENCETRYPHNVYVNVSEYKAFIEKYIPHLQENKELLYSSRANKGKSIAHQGDYPSLVTILMTPFQETEDLECGGTLIDYQWVLTAAHCFYN